MYLYTRQQQLLPQKGDFNKSQKLHSSLTFWISTVNTITRKGFADYRIFNFVVNPLGEGKRSNQEK